ncbi:hypothetical protein EZS27_042567, partial [termite gut metagenome]
NRKEKGGFLFKNSKLAYTAMQNTYI